jgi:hypothetical protein
MYTDLGTLQAGDYQPLNGAARLSTPTSTLR